MPVRSQFRAVGETRSTIDDGGPARAADRFEDG